MSVTTIRVPLVLVFSIYFCSCLRRCIKPGKFDVLCPWTSGSPFRVDLYVGVVWMWVYVPMEGFRRSLLVALALLVQASDLHVHHGILNREH